MSPGFTWPEVIVFTALIVAAAGIVYPLVSAEIRETKISRALDDTARIASAVMRAQRDAGAMPGSDGPGMPAAALVTRGRQPAGLPLGHVRRLSSFLGALPPAQISKGPWKGPYLGEVGCDPWKRAYVVLVPPAAAMAHAWALSAGPDGLLQTTESSSSLEGDDIGICIR